ncbi:prephenate dehydratase [Clostridium sp. cel8]|uniref:prephenate dehydratase n=1 Tax=unclassified Clostridium TaxID=2614128 RepID=UPI0015F63C8D|nr:prephenate dehydratase [Clostridium sp. cel8]MBA5850777.1 prephenate dehydratase [Clostridium sp. cel8]
MESLKHDKSYKIGFYGEKASFTHQALQEYFGDTENVLSCSKFKDVFDALESGNIKYGVVPIENSSTGGITDVYDLFRDYGFYIVGEKCIHVSHDLLGLRGTKLDDITEVYSHNQAFLQSRKYLENKNWKLIPYFSTAKSAKYISESGCKNKACIASRKAAELYNLDVIEKNINYNKNNYTRFVIVGREVELNSYSDKISVVFTLEHKVGTLCNILGYFRDNNLNMTKIESRPKIDTPWEYFFYIDFYGNLLNREVKDAVKQIRSKCKYFKLLGNYKTDLK